MGFKVSTEREFTVKHSHKVDEETYELEVTFKHLAGEDIDYDELRRKLSGVSDVKILNEETGEEVDNGSYNAFLYTLRKGLISCKGFTDSEDKDIIITQAGGKINSDMQIVVFEAVRTIPEFFDKIVTAYTGIDAKN